VGGGWADVSSADGKRTDRFSGKFPNFRDSHKSSRVSAPDSTTLVESRDSRTTEANNFLKLNFFLLFFSEKKRRDDNMYIEGAVFLGNRGEGRTGNPGISTGLTAQDV
jgi:hypothetical protein